MKRAIQITNIFCVGILLILSSCAGKKGNKTEASISMITGAAVSDLGSISDGGAIIYGKSQTDGQIFGQVINLASGFSIELDNGTWDFYALTWQKTNSTDPQLSGLVRCAVASSVTLDGSPVEVGLNLSNANCSNQVFGKTYNTSGILAFSSLKIKSCRTINHVTGNTSLCDNDFTTNPVTHNRGHISSFEISLPSFSTGANGSNNIIDNSNKLLGGCLQMQATGAENPGLNLPQGNGVTSPIFTLLKSHIASNDCGLTQPIKGIIVNQFPQGIAQNNIKAKSYFNGGNSYLDLYHLSLDSEVCTATAGNTDTTIHPFAVGTANIIDYGICTKEELNAVSTFAATDATSNFRLLKNINMLEDYNPTTDTGKFEFKMIGGLPINPYELTAEYTYSGHFYGNHKSIKGIMLDETAWGNAPYNRIGFIRQMNGGSVQDLIFIFPQIRLEQTSGRIEEVGVVVGFAQAGTKIKNITVISPEVEAFAMAGGLVGHADNIFISQSKVENLFIRGGQKLGGLVGFFENASDQAIYQSSASIEKIKDEYLHAGKCVTIPTCSGGYTLDNRLSYCVNNSIYTSGTCTTASGTWLEAHKMGGLVGDMQCSTHGSIGNIRESQAGGLVIGNEYLGGLIGFTQHCSIKNSYATTSLISTAHPSTPSRSLGGIIGATPGTGDLTIENSFHTEGAIITKPDNFANGIAGAAATAGTTTYNNNIVTSRADDSNLRATTVSLNDIRTISTFLTENFNISSTSTSAIWYMADDGYDYPRLSWENDRPCHQLFSGSPFAGGNGSEAAPYKVCSLTQLNNIVGYNTNNYFELAAHIDASSTPIQADGYLDFSTTGFNGHLSGGDFSIRNISVFNPSGNAGFMNKISPSGAIENLSIHGSKIVSQAPASPGSTTIGAGAITAINQGLVENIELYGTQVDGYQNVGGVAGVNENGLVIMAITHRVDITGGTSTGGIIGNNFGGGIFYAEFSGQIQPITPSLNHGQSQFGGIVGLNQTNGTGFNLNNSYDENFQGDAVISQVQSSGEIVITNGFTQAAGTQISKIGGVVGELYDGILDNSESRFRINDETSVTDSHFVACMAGYVDQASSIISKTIANCDFNATASALGPKSWGTIVGNDGTNYPNLSDNAHFDTFSGKTGVYYGTGTSSAPSPKTVGSPFTLAELSNAPYSFDITNDRNSTANEIWLMEASESSPRLFRMQEYEEQKKNELWEFYFGFSR